MVFLFAAMGIAALAAWIDFRTGHIPNWLTIVPLFGAIVAHLIHGAVSKGTTGALSEAGLSLAGAAVCSVVPVLMYRAGAMGGGDVKLFAALGAIMMVWIGIEAQLLTFVFAAVIAPARLAWEGRLWKSLGSTLRLAVNPFMPKAKRVEVNRETMTWFRLGPAIFLGTIAAVLTRNGG